jgi:hypothetical protein
MLPYSLMGSRFIQGKRADFVMVVLPPNPLGGSPFNLYENSFAQ